MGSKTISLEDSAYAKLRRSKRRDESFSDVVHRLLDNPQPSLLEFARLVDRRGAEDVAEVVARLRAEDLRSQRIPARRK